MISAQNFIVNVEFFKEVRSPWGLRETAALGTKKWLPLSCSCAI